MIINYNKASYLYDLYFGQIYLWHGVRTKVDKLQGIDNIIIMTLILTSDKGILTFKINDQEIIACDNITREKSLNYRMVISMGARNTTVQILD